MGDALRYRGRAAGPAGIGVACIVLVLTACADRRIEIVRRFNDARERGDLGAARAMLAPEPRIWFENPVGEGSPWTPGEGPWAGWDGYFRSANRRLGEYQRDGDAVFVIVEETNDYYRLTERRWSRTMHSWFVTDEGLIRGFMVAGVGETASRGGEFRAWVREHEPGEFAALFPGGRIDPSGDHPRRMKALLLRWRAAVGLPTIEGVPES